MNILQVMNDELLFVLLQSDNANVQYIKHPHLTHRRNNFQIPNNLKAASDLIQLIKCGQNNFLVIYDIDVSFRNSMIYI